MKKKNNIIPKDNEWTFEFIDKVYQEIDRIARDKFRFDIYPNQIEIITAEQMLDAYSSHGLPIMYNHWKFGKDYVMNHNRYKKGMMGLAYEIVLNTNPCISFNMEDNTACMTTLVIAHAAIGHNFCFKNNYLFRQWTDASSIVDYLVFAKNYIKECEEKYGEKEVEYVLDACHALQYCGVDKYKRTYKSKSKSIENINKLNKENDKLYDYLMEKTAPLKKKENVKNYNFPIQPEENLLYFVEKYAPKLETWKRELLRITRKLSTYFYPQIQTKTINEGCLVEGSLISTEDGLMDIKNIVDTKYKGKVWDGENWEIIYDWFKHDNKKRIKIITDNGYEIHGGDKHKIFNNNKWVNLNQLNIGDNIQLNSNIFNFPTRYKKIFFEEKVRENISEICKIFDTNTTTYQRFKSSTYKFNLEEKNVDKCSMVGNYINEMEILPQSYNKRVKYNLPTELKEKFAYWLGLLIGDGNVSKKNRVICFTCGDYILVEEFVKITLELFEYKCKVKKDLNRWRVCINSNRIIDYIQKYLDIKNGYSAPIKEIPKLIYESPKEVVSNFLSGLFDSDGCANKKGDTLIFTSRSYKLSKGVQELLLCFGIMSSKRFGSEKQKKDGTFYERCYRVTITGKNVEKFYNEIGFKLERKNIRISNFLESKKWFTKTDINKISKIISIEEDFGTTYDFSVSNSHKYQSGPFINHNCATFIHYHIINEMFEEGLVDEGFMLEFIASHTSVIYQPEFNSPYYSGFNPYALGFAIFMDVKRICQEPTDEDKQWFPELIGKDWIEMFHEIVKNYKDETFILQFLSPKVMRDFKMFYLLDDATDKEYVVKKIHNDEGYKDIREKLASNYNWNSMFPDIQVKTVDLLGDRKLKLVYQAHNNIELNSNMAEKTLKYLEYLWGYPVELSTVGLITKYKEDEEELQDYD